MAILKIKKDGSTEIVYGVLEYKLEAESKRWGLPTPPRYPPAPPRFPPPILSVSEQKYADRITRLMRENNVKYIIFETEGDP